MTGVKVTLQNHHEHFQKIHNAKCSREYCMPTILDFTNWNPFSSAHFWIEYYWDTAVSDRSDTRLQLHFWTETCKNHQHTVNLWSQLAWDLIILFIFNINKVTDKMAPCVTPISWSYKSETQEPACTLKDLSFTNLLMKSGNRPRRPASCKSRSMRLGSRPAPGQRTHTRLVCSKQKLCEYSCLVWLMVFRTSRINFYLKVRSDGIYRCNKNFNQEFLTTQSNKHFNQQQRWMCQHVYITVL